MYTYTLTFYNKSQIVFTSQSSSFCEAYLEYCIDNSEVPQTTYDYKREYDESKKRKFPAKD